MIEYITVLIGSALLLIGAICDLIGALGMNRFPNFFVRLHAATVGTIGGAFYPLIGAALIAFSSEYLGTYRWFVGGCALVSAFLILILAPAGSHALARAAHKSKTAVVAPKVVDHLEEDGGVR
ncbi:MAG: monovalent cation/H(+) antiporter subunit G [Sulfolobales archaeon]